MIESWTILRLPLTCVSEAAPFQLLPTQVRAFFFQRSSPSPPTPPERSGSPSKAALFLPPFGKKSRFARGAGSSPSRMGEESKLPPHMLGILHKNNLLASRMRSVLGSFAPFSVHIYFTLIKSIIIRFYKVKYI
jgi:hypothetical protein